MKTICSLLCFFCFGTMLTAQIPRTISYQGILNSSVGGPISDGGHVLVLRLYHAESGGAPVHEEVKSIQTQGGLFNTDIGPISESVDFAEALWLSVAVDGGEELTPRTELTVVPYAFHAIEAERAVVAEELDIPNAVEGDILYYTGSKWNRLPIGSDGEMLAIEGGLPNWKFNTLTWSLQGNSGTDEKVNFLGTTDNQAFEIHVDHAGFLADTLSGRGRILHFIPDNNSPIIVGGHHGNNVHPTSYGSSILGGGGYDTSSSTNVEKGSNRIDSGSYASVIASGMINTVGVGSYRSFIGTGLNNSIGRSTYESFLGSGSGNNISSGAYRSFIGTGNDNDIDKGAYGSFLGSGSDNSITGAYRSFIGSGSDNSIEGTAYESFLGGGSDNSILNDAHGSFIGGGNDNGISSGSYHSSIGGGQDNNIKQKAHGSSIGGGKQNLIDSKAINAVIGGGVGNEIGFGGTHSVISGGDHNRIGFDAQYSTIPGGRGLTLNGSGSFGFLGGNTSGTGNNSSNRMTVNEDDVVVFGNTDLWLANNDGTASELRLYEENTETGEFPSTTGIRQKYSAFVTEELFSRSIVYVLPKNPPFSGQQLTVSQVMTEYVDGHPVAKVVLQWQ